MFQKVILESLSFQILNFEQFSNSNPSCTQIAVCSRRTEYCDAATLMIIWGKNFVRLLCIILPKKSPSDGVAPSFSSKCCLRHAMVKMMHVMEEDDDGGN